MAVATMTTKRILNRADVLARVGFGKTTLYGLVRQGEFPRPVQTSVNRVGWLEAEVDSWIASRERAGSWR